MSDHTAVPVSEPRHKPPNNLVGIAILWLFLILGAALHLEVGPVGPLTFGFVMLGWILAVMAHEFGHALVSLGPGLIYSGESGALNEHLADVFGACVQQWVKQDQHDWRIGEEILVDGASAVRHMLHPGTAYDNDILGRDPQPGHMDQYKKIRADNGGVHINSGIPNRAFALLCEKTGEPSWGRPLAMWRRAMEDLGPRSTFKQLALATWTHSGGLNPAVREAWAEVGISI